MTKGNLLAAVAITLLSIPSYAITIPKTMHNDKIISDTNREFYGSFRQNGTYNFNDDLDYKESLYHVRPGDEKTKNFFHHHIEKVRFGIKEDIASNSCLGLVKAHVELEGKIQDDTLDSSKMSVKLREATVSTENFLLGHTQSTFIDPKAELDVISPSNPIGQPNYDISHFNVIRYNIPITKAANLKLALEENVFNLDRYTSDHKTPTVVAAFTYDKPWGHVSIRAFNQDLRCTRDAAKPKDNEKHGLHTNAIQLSGSMNIGKDKLIATMHHSNGTGTYGPNTANDYVQRKKQLIINNQICWQASYTHNWNDHVRSNAAFSSVNNMIRRRCLIRPYHQGGDVRTAQDCIVNTIVKIDKNIECGAEYVHEHVKLTHKHPILLKNRNKLNAMINIKF